jgi:hypothetical protein
MTLAENIAQATASLPPEKQRAVMDFVEFLKARPAVSQPTAPRPKRRASKPKAGLPPALRDVYGIWADRTDLPKDPVAAVRALRKRTAERRANG